MTTAIDFYFDFSSPYGYFASLRIDEIAQRHNRIVTWRPYLMGAAFKISGRQPLIQQPLVGEYAKRDMYRTARLYNVPFTLPSRFPIASVAACRAYYWTVDQDTARAKRLAHALYAAYFTDDRDISSMEEVAGIGGSIGLDHVALGTALADPALKQRLHVETDNAIARKVFGSPFIIIDEEPFWGCDRLDHADRWLETGGW